MKTTCLAGIGILVIVAVAVILPRPEAIAQEQQEQESSSHAAMKAVEDDVHEYMEYAFAPFFKQLKLALSEPPADRKAWVPVKANSLILAENGNLLMLRGPDENTRPWNRLAAELRDQGQHLYQAAKQRDYEAARKHYVSFVAKCNACHEQFADGEHMQEP